MAAWVASASTVAAAPPVPRAVGVFSCADTAGAAVSPADTSARQIKDVSSGLPSLA